MTSWGQVGRSFVAVLVIGGATIAAGTVAAGAQVGGAVTVQVASEAEYRQALVDLSADDSGPHTVAITADFTVSGAGDPTYTGTQPLTIDGNDHTVRSTTFGPRFLRHDTPADLTVRNVTVDAFASGGSGGAIASSAALTTLQGTTLQGSYADGDGGAVHADGALTVERSELSSNAAAGVGAAVHVPGGQPVTVDSSSLLFGVSGSGGGAIDAQGPVEITNSTFNRNTGDSTVDTGGGSLVLTYVTFVQELGRSPGDPFVTTEGTGALTSVGTVFAALGIHVACDVGRTTSSYSYSEDSSCGFTGTGDVQDGTNPGLAIAAHNGGPTRTSAFTADSPLFDAIPAAACDAVGIAVDQRDEPRPGTGSDACDIGAFELQLEAPIVPVDPVDPATPADAGPIRAAPPFTG